MTRAVRNAWWRGGVPRGRLGLLTLALAALVVLACAQSAAASGPPENISPPVISGTPTEGKNLKTNEGKWAGTVQMTHIVWEDCEGATCTPIEGATESSYSLQSGDVGKTIRVTVTAENSAGKATSQSKPTAVVAGTAPKNTTAPEIEQSEPQEGQVATATAGHWSGTPASKYIYVWEVACPKQRCSPIVLREESTQTKSSYRVPSSREVEGQATVTVTVTDENVAGSKTVGSKARHLQIGPPVNEAAPTITGTPREGQPIDASAGTWGGTPPFGPYEYQWLVCKPLEAGACQPIAGATSAVYTPTATEAIEGDDVEVQVTATNVVGRAVATSAAVLVLPNPPANTASPAISGNAEEGETLTASNGSWENAGPTFEYQWLRCNHHHECQPILRATGASHVVSWQDVGMTLAVTVTTSNGSGPASATSSESSSVPGGTAALGWGNNYPSEQLGSGIQSDFESSPVTVADIEDVKQMAVVTDSSFALLANGTVKSWGGNLPSSGVLGDNSFEKTSTKVTTGSPQTVVEETEEHELQPLEHVTMLAAAGEHVMALLENGHVATWGSSTDGDRGNGEKGTCYGTAKCVLKSGKVSESIPFARAEEKGFVRRDVAYEVPHLSEVVDIAAGGATDYALLKNGTVEAWGANTKGMLGVDWIGSGSNKGPSLCNNEACSPTPRAVCAVGAELKDEPEVPQEDWPCTSVLEGVTAISAGAETAGHEGTAYAISHGRLVAWGNDRSGQVGNGSTATEVIGPTYVDTSKLVEEGAIPAGEEAVSVAGGNNFALALLADGQMIGWGNNNVGEIGGESHAVCMNKQESETCQLTPKLVGALPEVSEIAAGLSIGFAVSDGTAYGIGYAEHGQLGVGKASKEPPPEDMCGEIECRREWSRLANVGRNAGRPVSQIVADSGPIVGGAHNFAVTASGTPPPPQMSLTAGVGSLELAWTFGQWTETTPGGKQEYGKQEYGKVKWQRVPTPGELRPFEEKEQVEQEAKQLAEESAYEAAQEGEKQQAEEYEREAASDKATLKEIEAKAEQLYKEVSNGEPWQLAHAPRTEVENCGVVPCTVKLTEYFGQPFGSAEHEGMKVEERYEVKVEEQEEKEGGYKKVYGTPEF